MNKELEAQLAERFSFMRPELNEVSDPMLQNSYDRFGIEASDGWFKLIWDLCLEIEEFLAQIPKGRLVVHQIKEKFGELRFYARLESIDAETHPISKEQIRQLYDIIDRYQDMSAKVCETCGKPGKLVEIGHCGGRIRWVRTLCEDCDDKLRRSLEERKTRADA